MTLVQRLLQTGNFRSWQSTQCGCGIRFRQGVREGLLPTAFLLNGNVQRPSAGDPSIYFV